MSQPGNQPDDRQLGVYLHWPYCAVICPYCDFNVYRARSTDHAPLVNAILADLAYWREQIGPRRLTSLFFGGGTPSLLPAAAVSQLIEACAQLWGFEEDAEICLEANPTDAETSRFEDIASAGVNRLSLGVQSFQDGFLKFLGRNHDGEASMKAALKARAIFPQLSLDFIYALPDQSVADWTAELARATQEIGPDHISPYQLTIEQGTAFGRAVARGKWMPVDADLGAEFFLATSQQLNAAGFEAYEVSNHARHKASRSQHNQLYWNSQDWIGVGPGAHGRLGEGAGRLSTLTAAKPVDYIAAVAATGTAAIEQDRLGLDAAREEYWMMGLRVLDGADPAKAPGAPLDLACLEGLIDAGFLEMKAGRLALTGAGVPVADAVIRQLLV